VSAVDFTLLCVVAFGYVVYGVMFVFLFNNMDEYENLERKTKLLMRLLILILWPAILVVGGLIWSIKQAIKILFGE